MGTHEDGYEVGYEHGVEDGRDEGRAEMLRKVATLPSPWHVTRWRTDRDLWGRCEWCGFSEPVVTRTHPKNGCLWEKANEIGYQKKTEDNDEVHSTL